MIRLKLSSAIILLLASVISCRQQTSRPEPARIVDIDRTQRGLIIYYPHFVTIDLACGTMPSKGDSAVNFCCEASFTGQYLDEFNHFNVAGDHVSSGVRYHGFRCRKNTGAFVYYDGGWKFLYKDFSNELDSAAFHGGMGFGQEMMIHEGEEVAHVRSLSNVNLFRALCEIDGRLCIADATDYFAFGTFIAKLKAAGATEALYLDMGSGWNFSWYREFEGGAATEIHPHIHDFTTNWVVFRYKE